MKRFLLLFVALAAVACSDDDATTIANYQGVYRTVGLYNYQGEFFDTTVCPTGGSVGFYRTYMFDEANNYAYYNTCEEDEDYDEEGTYTLVGNQLTVNNSLFSVVYTVSDLGNGKVQWQFTETIDGEDYPVRIILQRL